MDEKDFNQPQIAEAPESSAPASGKKRRHPFAKGFLCGILAAILVSGAAGALLYQTKTVQTTAVAEQTSGTPVLNEEVAQKLNALYEQINLYYYDSVDEEAVADNLYKGLFDGLGDPYSGYYTAEEYENLLISTNANYYGIGAVLSQDIKTMQVTITHIYDDSGAKAAGLREGDMIVQVGDIVATSMELSDLVTQIRGEQDTTVHLTIYRESESDYLEFDVMRGEINIPTVEHEMLDGDVGYIIVSEFSQNTPQAFTEAITDLLSQGMQYMIVDLRSNGGGLVDACQEMLDVILPEGVVVYAEDKYGNRNEWTSDAENYMDIPLVVLVNEYSASASEIFAGAIRDFDYGTLVGTTTFGKGIMQSIVPLKDGSAFKLTTASYFTPSGENIHGKGISPDVEVEYEYTGDPDAEDYDELQDSQIIKAIEVLKGN